MRELINRGIKTAIEIGPGKVLAGLMRRITKDIKTVNLGTPEDLKELSQHN
jgi:[acyl-carrier-protein] S-malonyltransferase